MANLASDSATTVGVTVPAWSFNLVAVTFSLNLIKLRFLNLTTDWFVYTSKYAFIASRITSCSTLINFSSFNLILSLAILYFSNDSPPSNIFLLREIVEVIESSFI